MQVLLALSATVVLAAAVALFVVFARRRGRPRPDTQLTANDEQPKSRPSTVRVLCDDIEIAAALAAAAETERRLLTIASRRYAHYQQVSPDTIAARSTAAPRNRRSSHQATARAPRTARARIAGLGPNIVAGDAKTA